MDHTVSPTQYDAFGEPVTSLPQRGAAPSRASRVAVRTGVGLFWSLVAGIVAARVVTFDPDFARSFGALASTCLHAVLPS